MSAALSVIRGRADAVLAGALAASGLLALALSWDGGIGTGTGPTRRVDELAAVIVLAQSLPLAWRRRAPLIVLTLVAAAYATHHVVNYPPNPSDAGLFVALYTVPAHRRGPARGAAGLVAAAVVGVDVVAASRNGHAMDAGAVAVYLVLLLAFCAAGALVATRRAYVAALELRLADLQRLREFDARQAAARERTRLARELHDVISHHVSVMVVQADAAEVTLDADPARARRSVRAVAATGRSALAELGRLLGLLRSGDEPEDAGEGPGLAQLGALTLRMAEAGLVVDVEVSGTPVVLPDGVDAAAFLVVREAVTNGLRHAGSGSASVLLDYRAGELAVRVVTGGDLTPGRSGGGFGLLGMREHAEHVGGRLDVGRRGSAFVTEAWFPTADARDSGPAA